MRCKTFDFKHWNISKRYIKQKLLYGLYEEICSCTPSIGPRHDETDNAVQRCVIRLGIGSVLFESSQRAWRLKLGPRVTHGYPSKYSDQTGWIPIQADMSPRPAHPYMFVVFLMSSLFVLGHRQTVQIQIRRRVLHCFLTDCSINI